jgi:hypothetical protein
MGGSGSGSWYRVDSKTLTEHCINIDVRHLSRKGCLVPGQRHSWKWKDGNNIKFETKPEAIEVDTGKYGLVALIPMGMAQVSSVIFEDNVKVGTTHEKGDVLGNFLFGGSDFVMLFQESAGFEMTATSGNHILMGEKYGVMKGAQL